MTNRTFLCLDYIRDFNFLFFSLGGNDPSRLDRESRFYFNIRCFEDSAPNGEWDDVEKYLSGFMKVDNNRYSMKIFFKIQSRSISKRDRAKAVEILVKDLKVFAAFNDDLFKAQLLTLENFRYEVLHNEQLSKNGDTKSALSIMLAELNKLIEANPPFRGKLQFPTLKNSRLRALINQRSLLISYARNQCLTLTRRLFGDRTCGQPNGARVPSPVANPLMGAVPKPGAFLPLTALGVSLEENS
ncbi:hypothetical protein ACJRO7_014347 [Eucalyptus globulus]|uniref:CTLH domain-containing protein n=1 Tax=Eucalyptus globulus TaxID=34317 RepID=A0ABD3KZU9_EUCGL